MSSREIFALCKQNLEELNALVSTVEVSVLSDNLGSEFIRENVNFFTKSFLLTICANLETCIKDVIYSFVLDFEHRIAIAAIPFTIADFKFNGKSKKRDGQAAFELFKLDVSKKDIDEMVSGNVYKTKEAFMLVGINLASDHTVWESWKELIQSIVTRRNNVVHHNYDASDLSFGDIKSYITNVVQYLDYIETMCS